MRKSKASVVLKIYVMFDGTSWHNCKTGFPPEDGAASEEKKSTNRILSSQLSRTARILLVEIQSYVSFIVLFHLKTMLSQTS